MYIYFTTKNVTRILSVLRLDVIFGEILSIIFGKVLSIIKSKVIFLNGYYYRVLVNCEEKV